MENRVKITKSSLINDINNGLTRKEIAIKLNLPITQVNKVFNEAGLKGTKPKKISYLFEDDTANTKEVGTEINTNIEFQC